MTRRFLAVLAVALIASLGLVARAGAFSFDTSATFQFDGDVNDIAAGDLNGDGRDDIVVASNTDQGPIRVFLNNGDGTFDAGATYGAGTSARHVHIVPNLAGDGHAAIAYSSASGLWYLTQDGPGHFGSPVTVDTGGTAVDDFAFGTAAAAGTGIAFANYDNGPWLHYGGIVDGAGGVKQFQEGAGSPAALPADYVRSLRAVPYAPGHADDIAVQTQYQGGGDVVSVLRESSATYAPIDGSPFTGILRGAGDVDTANGPDLLSSTNVFLNDGDGGLVDQAFAPFDRDVSDTADPTGTLADFDGDGKPDLIGPGNPGLPSYTGDGAGHFMYAGDAASADDHGHQIVFQPLRGADLDGHGQLDLVAGQPFGYNPGQQYNQVVALVNVTDTPGTPTTTTLTLTPSTSHGAQDGTNATQITASGRVTAPPGHPIPRGSVALKRDGTTLDTVTLAADGTYSDQLTGVSAGTSPVVAESTSRISQADSSASAPLRVGYDAVTVNADDPAQVSAGDTGTVTGSVTANDSTAPTPAGAIVVNEGSTQVGSGTLTSTGRFSVTLDQLDPGSHTLTILFSDDLKRFDDASATKTLVVDSPGAATTTSVNVPSHVHATLASGASDATGSATISGTVSSPGHATPRGTVTLTRDSSTLATVNLAADGTYSKTVSGLAVGSSPVVASFAPSTSQSASTTTSGPLVVGHDAATVRVDAPAPIAYNERSTLTGRVTANDAAAGAPIGTMVVKNGTTQIGGGDLAPDGSFSVGLDPLPAGTYTFTVSFSDAKQRFDGASASLTVTVSSTDPCYAVDAKPLTTWTRGADGRPAQVDLGESVIQDPSSTAPACTGAFTPLSGQFRRGAKLSLVATPPAYETVTGIRVTPSSGDPVTLPVALGPAGSLPGGRAATATWTVSSPATVEAIVEETTGDCTTVGAAAHWKGDATSHPEVAGVTLAGALGCRVAAGDATQVVNPGDRVQVIPGTPLRATFHGRQITDSAGTTSLGGWDAAAGAQADGDALKLAPRSATTVGVAAQLTCQPLPAIATATGGGTAYVSKRLADPSGLMAPFADGACPAAWGSGVLPGVDLTYKATAAGYDKTLGPASDYRRATWFLDGWDQLDATPDTDPVAAAKRLATLSLQPVAAGELRSGDNPVRPVDPSAPAPTPHRGHTALAPSAALTKTFRTPAATGGPQSPVLAAVGARFYHLGCVTVTTKGFFGSGVSGAPQVLGQRDAGGADVPAGKGASVSVDVLTPPNCPQGGANLYKPGTKIHVRAKIDGTTKSVVVDEPHPQGYTGTDVSAYAPVAAQAAAAGHSRRARRKGGRRPAPRPAAAPPAAARVVTAADAVARGAGKVAPLRVAASRAYRVVRRARSAEAKAQAALARAQRRGDPAAERSAFAAFEHTWKAWTAATNRALRADGAVGRATVAAIEQREQAAMTTGAGEGAYSAYRLAVLRLQSAALEKAGEITRQQAARAARLVAGSRRAARRGGIARRQLAREAKLLATTRAAARWVARRSLTQRALVRQQVRASGKRADRLARAAVGGLTRAVRRVRSARPRHARRAHAAAAGGGSRALYDDEKPAGNGRVEVGATFLGLDAIDDDGHQTADGPTAEFVTGTSNLTINATAGPKTCEKPKIVADPQYVSAKVDGGASTCAGPDSATRLGSFAVIAAPNGPYTPVMVFTGQTPDGTIEKRVQTGAQGTFPALRNASVEIQACLPIELGGHLADDKFSGDTPVDPSIIGEFASGSECDVPGLYKAGTQVSFHVPGWLSTAVDVPGYRGSIQWTVDGQDPTTNPPTVTVDKDQPQHSVGIVAHMTCGRVEVDEDAASGLIATYNLPQPAVFNTITDCPADHADAGVRDVKRTEYTRIFGTHRESVGYFRPNENVKFQVDNGSANPDCNGDSYLGDPSSWSRKFLPSGEQTTKSTPAGVADQYQVAADPNAKDYSGHAGRFAAFSYCGGFGLRDSPSVADFGIWQSVIDGVVSFVKNYIVEPVLTFVQRAQHLFTTNPFTSWDAFKTFATDWALVSVTWLAPGSGFLALSAAGNSNILESPESFGRFMASMGVKGVVGGAQAVLFAELPAVAPIIITAADPLIGLVSDKMQDAGGTLSDIGKGLRSLRVVTNAFGALSDCASGAAAGEPVPTSDDRTSLPEVSQGVPQPWQDKAKTKVKGLLGFDTPPPLPTIRQLRAAGVGRLSSVSQGLKNELKNNKVSAALTTVMAVHEFTNAGVTWSADDFESCLAYNTFG